MFQYQDIPFKNAHVDQVTTFFDTGSNVNLVTEEFIKRAKLPGRPVFQSLVTTRAKASDWHTNAYQVPLIDWQGKVHAIIAFSMGAITLTIEEVDLRPALKVFPELGNDYRRIKRPLGKVDLHIGTNDVRLHPYLAERDRHLKRNLRLMTSIFGSGVIANGSHPDIKASPHHDYQEED